MKQPEVAIVGAGPNGLSVAAYLHERKIPFRIFGEPMIAWLNMPRGMFLKSFGFATSIYSPQRGLDFARYCRERGREAHEPCSIKDFAEYGLWAQKQVAPELEQVKVTSLKAAPEGGFELQLDTGEKLRVPNAVVAVGLGALTRMPPELIGLPETHVTHSSQHRDFDGFAGKDVAVIGAGQSALEAAALLHEQGAHPTLVMRGPAPYFYGKTPKERGLLERLRNPFTVLGTGRFNWVLEKFPYAMHYAPEARRVRFTKRYLGPSGAWWLRDRFEGKVPVLGSCTIAGARVEAGKVLLRLRGAGGQEREERFDHVVAGSGYEFDLDKMGFLDPALRAGLARIERAPALSRHFEASARGLYFLGPIAAPSFGPLVRFVCGAQFAAPTVVGHIARQRGLLASLLRAALPGSRSASAPGTQP